MKKVVKNDPVAKVKPGLKSSSNPDSKVEVEPGLKFSPNPESKVDVPNVDDVVKKEEEDEDENGEDDGYPDHGKEPPDQEYYERESFYEGESLEEEVVVPDAHHNIRDIPREEFLTFEKVTLKNDVGYVSKKGEFFQCDVCSKHQKKEQSKDAHADYCRQSMKYNDF